MNTSASPLRKAFAILKDSLREALDIKILYVVLVLAVFFNLFVLTMSFRPVPVEEVLEAKYSFFNFLLGSNPNGKITLSVADFKRLDAGTDPWTGDYQFLLNVDIDARAPEHLRKEFSGSKMMATARELCDWADQVDVKLVSGPAKEPPLPEGAPKPAPKDVKEQFLVTTHGTHYKTRQEWYHQPAFFFGAVDLPAKTFRLNQIVSFIASYLVGGFGSGFIMLLSAVITAFFIPNMMSKGTIDLLLTKPIHRLTLFIYKFVGGLIFMIVLTAVIMGGLWLGLGLKAGVWCNMFLLCILVYTFEFAIFYAVSALVGVVTRTPILSILAVVAFWAMLTGVGWTHRLVVESPRRTDAAILESGGRVPTKESGWVDFVVNFLHAVMPRYKDLDWLTDKSISAELIKPSDLSQPGMQAYYDARLKQLDREYPSYTWGESLGVSALFIVIVVGFTGWLFTARDY